MTLEASFETVVLRFRILRDAVSSLHVTVVEDNPQTGAALVDNLATIIEDLIGHLEAAETAAREGQEAVAYPTDSQKTQRSVVICQQSFGHERGGEWRGWTNTVIESLKGCRQPVFEVDQALFMCWQELAERMGMNSVSMHSTNIGQKIEVLEKKDLVAEGVP
jgi:hypothetical protein